MWCYLAALSCLRNFVFAVSKNEAIRKHLATALIHLYSHVNNSLVQVSVETTNTLNFTQVRV